MGWLTGWIYRKPVTISRASGAISNYQLKLLLGESSGAVGEDVDCGAKCLSSFNDIRFTSSNGTSLLSYWIESITGGTPNQLATIWIKFDSIGTSATTFYMYYGKVGASAVSSGTDTFIWFDDFNRADSGTVGNDWVETVDDDFSILSNKLKIVAGSGDGDLYHDGHTPIVQSIIEAKMQINSTSKDGRLDWNRANLRLSLIKFNGPNNKIQYINSTSPYYHDTDVSFSADTDYILGIRHDPDTELTDYYVNRIAKAIDQTEYGTILNNAGRVHFYDDVSLTGTVLVDWILIRQLADTEPAWGSWGSESGGNYPLPPHFRVT